ncbi:MAG: CoA transferase [Alphaproteobacteria bacterium]|nr:CoA transferase [Alphaproteobacteria bacterium]
MSGNLPLSGVRIVAVEQYGAGPFGTAHLADLGAEVIKIENPREGGDIGRQIGPYFFSEDDSQFYEAFNRNKKSIALDLKQPGGRQVLLELVKTADAVLDNLRGDLPAKLGLDYAALSFVNPKIVCVHLSAYGRTGSRASWPGYDYLMQAEAGYLSMTGEPDGPPSRAGLSLVDLSTGTTAAMALLAGVIDAMKTGRGRDLDVSLYDTALHQVCYLGVWYLNGGHITLRQPRSSHPSLTPSQLYTTKDGWIFIMCQKEKFWHLLCEALGRPEWIKDPDFATFAARLENRPRVNAALDEVLSAKTTDEWMKEFAGCIPAAPVYDVAQALNNGFAHEQERIVEFHHPVHGPIKGIASPVRVSGAILPAEAAPTLGRDTDDLLTQIGYSADQLAGLRKSGSIG